MTPKQASVQELTEEHLTILYNIPGFRLGEGFPCTCGPDSLTTRKRMGYSDSAIFTHTCAECGNQFETFIEG